MNRLEPPHDFGMGAANMLLPTLREDIAANTKRFLSGNLDDNLAVIFNTLSLHTLYLACLKLFYTDAPFEESLDLLGQSAQANKFRLLGDGRSKHVLITWAGATREIAVQRPIDMHNTLGIAAALVNAKLTGRTEDLAFLAGIPRKNMVHPGIRQPEETLRFTAFLQGLYRGVPFGGALEALFDSEKDYLRWSVPGLLCFPALGICALAKSAGIEIACENPYVPQSLLSKVS